MDMAAVIFTLCPNSSSALRKTVPLVIGISRVGVPSLRYICYAKYYSQDDSLEESEYRRDGDPSLRSGRQARIE